MEKRIFISSVQKEFLEERRELKKYIESDPLLGGFFSVYLFESTSAHPKSAEEVYLQAVEDSDIYICLIGNEYGYEDKSGISPTQKEYESALRLKKRIYVFVKESDRRAAKESAFLKKIESEFARKKFFDLQNLKTLVYESLVDLLREEGHLTRIPFAMRIAKGVKLSDLNSKKIAEFVKSSNSRRGFKFRDTDSARKILVHMGLISDGGITNAAVLLFGKNPQLVAESSVVKCVQFNGTEVEKPIPDFKRFDGTLFEMIDNAADFVMSKLKSGIANRDAGGILPFDYEIPRSAVFEAIANAVAHRNYASDGSVQVMVFRDRVLILNPGNLPSELPAKKIFEPHESLSPNRPIAQALFWAGYIETLGSGFIDMKNACRKSRLPIPSVENDHGTVSVTLYRPKNNSIPQVTPQAIPQVTPQVKLLLNAINGEMDTSELMQKIGISDRKYFRTAFVVPAIKAGFIEMTNPDSPRSPKQKYRITELGIRTGSSI